MFKNTDDNELTFGGYPVTLRLVDLPGGKQDVLVHAKNVTGTYTQANAFIKNLNPTNVYPFGIKTTEPAFLTHIPGGNIRIACLTDTKEKFMDLYNRSEEMLGLQ